MTTQKIVDILFNNGYKVTKDGSYEATYYIIRDIQTSEIVFDCKGAKDLKNWYNIMNDRYNFKSKYNILNIPKYDLNGMYR